MAGENLAGLEKLRHLGIRARALAERCDAQRANRLVAHHHGNAQRAHRTGRGSARPRVAALVLLKVAHVHRRLALDGEAGDPFSDGNHAGDSEDLLRYSRRVGAHVQHAVGAELVDRADLRTEVR